MIVFDLACTAQGHVFEAWFGSSADYEEQQARGLVQCPMCGAPEVEKAVMAPRLSAKGDPAAMKRMLGELAAVQRRLLAGSEHVGGRFADEARAIHLGEAPERPIHGCATPAQAESLIADGIAVAPLPFPVAAPGEEN